MTVLPPGLVLVTGASGFIAAHIVTQLLEAGYRVRGTARGPKLEILREHFRQNPNFEAVKIEDIVTGDLSEALEGVDAIVHAASPIAGKAPPAELLTCAIDGTLNVLRQAIKAGVYKVIMMSSYSSFLDVPQKGAWVNRTISERDWGEASRDDLANGDHPPFHVYCGSKILSEKAAWEFAEEHPELDLATINPPFIYGPYVLHPGNSPALLGSNILLYQLIAGKPGRPLPQQLAPFYCHTRDAARAHVLALTLPKVLAGTDIRVKRFLVAGPTRTLWANTARYLAEKHPELQSKLPSLECIPDRPPIMADSDSTRAREVLGLHEFVSWEETVEDTIKALLEVEQTWS
ncbi:hypothetical protein C8Q76DRAFT_332939 [Earliella scabrosa]|nr:hypothetical protein C8Q76DRAFT_332939 [Earliella scabrosa]